MMALWAPHENVICIHPMGPALTDRAAIRASWMEIFAAPANHRINIELLSETVGDDVASRTVVETFSIADREERFAPILATNVFSRNKAGWLLVAHHASPGRNQSGAAQPVNQTRH